VRLFEKRSLQSPTLSSQSSTQYDVSRDSKQFVILDSLISEVPLSIHFVHNWFEKFRGREREWRSSFDRET
jgi:hypothetical protein